MRWVETLKTPNDGACAVRGRVRRLYVARRGNNTGGADGSTSTPGQLEIYGLTQ